MNSIIFQPVLTLMTNEEVKTTQKDHVKYWGKKWLSKHFKSIILKEEKNPIFFILRGTKYKKKNQTV